jgi:Zn finger protein HypA/HybF involved in hydrogenase expression
MTVKEKKLNASFKTIKAKCKNCRKELEKTVLIINDYGFDEIKCNNCSERNFIEIENDNIEIK